MGVSGGTKGSRRVQAPGGACVLLLPDCVFDCVSDGVPECVSDWGVDWGSDCMYGCVCDSVCDNASYRASYCMTRYLLVTDRLTCDRLVTEGLTCQCVVTDRLTRHFLVADRSTRYCSTAFPPYRPLPHFCYVLPEETVRPLRTTAFPRDFMTHHRLVAGRLAFLRFTYHPPVSNVLRPGIVGMRYKVIRLRPRTNRVNPFPPSRPLSAFSLVMCRLASLLPLDRLDGQPSRNSSHYT